MKGDSILIEPHHEAAARAIVEQLLPRLRENPGRFALSVAGESGSGKSETARAIAAELARNDLSSTVFQQDNYFILPPRSNDAARREDISRVGPHEVRLDLMNQHIAQFLDGDGVIEKPLVDYASDSVGSERLDTANARVAIADGTYTSLLPSLDARVFIDRDFRQTRKHRERRMRDASELDEFIDRVLEIEHEIISAHRDRADFIIRADYSVEKT